LFTIASAKSRAPRYQWPNIIRPYYRSPLISHRARARQPAGRPASQSIHKKINAPDFPSAIFALMPPTRAVIGAAAQ